MSLVSPVFGKEMVTLARRKRHFFLRAIFLSALVTVIWQCWTRIQGGMQMYPRYYGGFNDLSRLGRELFSTFTLYQFWLVVLIVPALTAPVIAAEKEQDTLGLLLMTNLGHRHILVDKLLSRMALVSLLLLSALPLFLVMLAFRGIEPRQILASYVLILSTMLFCAGVGLLVSTNSSTMRSALVGTYLALIAYVVVGAIIVAVAEQFAPYSYRPIWSGIPNYRLVQTIAAFVFPVPILMSDGQVGYFPILSILAFVFAVKRCAKILPVVAERSRPSFLKMFFARMNRQFEAINITGVTFLHDNVPLRNNPLLWRETTRRFCCSRTFLLRSGYVLVAVYLLASMAWTSLHTMAFISAVHLIALGAFAVILSATAFSAEKEKHTLDLLLCTSQESASFIKAKFFGVLKALSVLAIVPLVMPLILMPLLNWKSEIEWLGRLCLIALTIIVFLPPVIALGLYFSAKCRRATTAIVLTVLTLAIWFAIPGGVNYYRERMNAQYAICAVDQFTVLSLILVVPALVAGLLFMAKRGKPILALVICPVVVLIWVMAVPALMRWFGDNRLEYAAYNIIFIISPLGWFDEIFLSSSFGPDWRCFVYDGILVLGVTAFMLKAFQRNWDEIMGRM